MFHISWNALEILGHPWASYIQLQRLGSQGSLHRLQARAGSNRKNWMIIILYYCLPMFTPNNHGIFSISIALVIYHVFNLGVHTYLHDVDSDTFCYVLKAWNHICGGPESSHWLEQTCLTQRRHTAAYSSNYSPSSTTATAKVPLSTWDGWHPHHPRTSFPRDTKMMQETWQKSMQRQGNAWI